MSMSEEAKKGLSEEQVADLKEAFAMFDINGDGMFCFVLSDCSGNPVSRGQVILDQQVGFLGPGLDFVTFLGCVCMCVCFDTLSSEIYPHCSVLCFLFDSNTPYYLVKTHLSLHEQD